MSRFLEGYVHGMSKVREIYYVIEKNHKTAELSPDYDKITWDNFRRPIKITMKNLVDEYKLLAPYHHTPTSKINLEEYNLK